MKLRLELVESWPFADSQKHSIVELSFRLDYRRLAARYKQNQSIRDEFAAFCRYWRTTPIKRRLTPAARLYLIPSTTSPLLMNPHYRDLAKESTKAVLLAVWTIGPVLETEATRLMNARSMLQGMLLDVMGTMILISIHRRLRRWINTTFARALNLKIIEEIQPGMRGHQLSVQTAIVTTTRAEKLDVRVTPGGILSPMKSHTAIFLLGDKSTKGFPKGIPCDSCQKKNCLYFQLGGCHL